jgi:Fe-S cluster biogenesis protein NfuA
MPDTLDARDFQAKLRRLDALLQGVERLANPSVRAQTLEVVQAILELHGAGLERILGHLAEADEAGAAAIDACARDEVASGLLLLHDLHPLDAEARVQLALEQVRPYLQSHGGNVELLGIGGDGVARLRLVGSCHGCPSSALTMKQTIEEAILGRAPDVAAIEVEGETSIPMTTPDGRPLVALSVS